MSTYKSVARTNHFIVLDDYEKYSEAHEVSPAHQSESQLERSLIDDLVAQGYVYRKDIRDHASMLRNVRIEIERLNDVRFSDNEWQRYLDEYLARPSEGVAAKIKKVQEDAVYDFCFDDGHLQNIHLIDKHRIERNSLQVIHQFEQDGVHHNRYDVSLLVNGLPLVHVELKRRGVSVKEAFNQIHRYSKESFNSEGSLYQYVQLFVISNGTDSRYFANTLKREKSTYDFTMNWARVDNRPIKDLKDFTATFFERRTLLKVLFDYSVMDESNTLLVMRPYQIAATERILWKIRSTAESNKWSSEDSGGYVWHTTGSGKTLTSFKAARLATQLDCVDKVFFVVDRKDLDYQTMKEYQRFSPDSVLGSNSTAQLKAHVERREQRIIVTTIQKLHQLVKSESSLRVYGERVVFIFDECHRSQFGAAQRMIRKKFKRYCQFGFTGTPIFPENALGAETTASVFGRELHSYIITDAIRDEKVLRFNVVYNDVRPKFREIEQLVDWDALSAAEHKKAFLMPERVSEIVGYILEHFDRKTHRGVGSGGGFNAMFAVSSVKAAQAYYDEFDRQKDVRKRPLKVATIFSFAANEEQAAKGDVADETMNPEALDESSKEFLSRAISNYNTTYGTNYSVESGEFQNYYKDLAKRVKRGEVDLLIVVGMFLTGFDAPGLNTLFVDKNLRYHGLIQAFSRTNRIYGDVKSFGNIVTFRDLEGATVDAIKLFGKNSTREVILEKSYEEYMAGFVDLISGRKCRGYTAIVREIKERFPDAANIETVQNQKDFVKAFGEYLRVDNVLQNYDEYTYLQEWQSVDKKDEAAVETFKQRRCLTDEDLAQMSEMTVLTPREKQDYSSTYNAIRDKIKIEKENREVEESSVDWDDVVFEVDLLKQQEINLDYILDLVMDCCERQLTKDDLLEEVKRVVRSSIGHRAKEGLIVDFIHATDLNEIKKSGDVVERFFAYAQEVKKKEMEELIAQERLESEGARRFIDTALRKERVSGNGTELKELLPKMSVLNKKYVGLKERVEERIRQFVEKFKGV